MEGELDGKAFQNHMLMERFYMVVEFLNQKLGESWKSGHEMSKPQELLIVLKSGVTLCRMVGVKPKPVEENKAAENIENFRRACLKLGLAEDSVFAVSDLLEPSSLSCICVVNCLQELRKKMLEMDRALLNEHYSSPTSSRKTMRNSPMGTPVISRKIASPSPSVKGKGLLDILPGNSAQKYPSGDQYSSPRYHNSPSSAPRTPGSGKSVSRRISLNSLNAQASIAKVQERMAKTYKDRCKQLEAGNKELMESVEDLQSTIASLQRSKHEYQLQCEKSQDRNRTLLSNFRVMEAQIVTCVEAWRSCKPTVEESTKVCEVDRHMVALHETWNDIIEEKDVSTGIAGDISDGQVTETECDTTDEDIQPPAFSEDKASSFKADLAATASLLADDLAPGRNPRLSSISTKELDLSRDTSQVKALEEELETTKQLLANAKAEGKDSFEVLEKELEVTKQMLSRTKERCASLERELKQERSLRDTIQKSLTNELATVKFEFADLSNDLRSSLKDSASTFSTWASELQSRVKVQAASHKNLQAQFAKETVRRKKLLNTVHNLKGNIRVMCRIRPVLSSDLEKSGSSVAVEPISEEKLSITVTTKSAAGTEIPKVTDFEFDRVFGPTSAQNHVFDEVQPLVESVMDGYHSCIFAYGQTGSGKTFTMSGDGGSENRGINFLALEELFRIHESRKSTGTTYKFTVKNVEIYCEKVIDLLTPPGDSPTHLDIHFTERDGVIVPGCTEQPVSTASEVEEVMNVGSKNRSSAHTKMNMESSRSHSVVIVTVHGENAETGRLTHGKLVLVDLAGSERLSKSGVQGQELKEAQSINKSLSCLGDVIAALESKAAHVPFRNSKLTTLLQDSLGKDNKALMILQVSPTTYNVQESTCSLNFAARVRQCELGKAKKREGGGISSKARNAVKQATERSQALELDVRRLEKRLSEANSELRAVEDRVQRETEKIRARMEEQQQNFTRSSEKEINYLREKLASRDKDDHGKMAKLESEIHQYKIEINNLKQQLRSALSTSSRIAPSPSKSSHLPKVNLSGNSPHFKPSAGLKHSLQPPKPAVGTKSSARELPLSDRSGHVNNVDAEHKTPEQRKQVSWKNTPVVVFPSERKDSDNDGDGYNLDDSLLEGSENQSPDEPAETANHSVRTSRSSSRTSQSSHQSGGAAAASRISKSSGATRVLQTPGKKSSASATRLTARRIPAASKKPRPGWNP